MSTKLYYEIGTTIHRLDETKPTMYNYITDNWEKLGEEYSIYFRMRKRLPLEFPFRIFSDETWLNIQKELGLPKTQQMFIIRLDDPERLYLRIMSETYRKQTTK